MQTPDNQSLPEKCCVKCGFLYGTAVDPSNRDDAIFDPDLIRLRSVSSSMGEDVTSRPYIIQKRTKTAQIRRYSWTDTSAFCCLKNQYYPMTIKSPEYVDKRQEEIKEILTEIYKDRPDCDGFFEYHPGFTSPQHTELQIEQTRIEQQDKYTERAIKLSDSLKKATWGLFIVTAGLVCIASAQIVIQVIALITDKN